VFVFGLCLCLCFSVCVCVWFVFVFVFGVFVFVFCVCVLHYMNLPTPPLPPPPTVRYYRLCSLLLSYSAFVERCSAFDEWVWVWVDILTSVFSLDFLCFLLGVWFNLLFRLTVYPSRIVGGRFRHLGFYSFFYLSSILAHALTVPVALPPHFFATSFLPHSLFLRRLVCDHVPVG
jgi:hypothetical protein